MVALELGIPLVVVVLGYWITALLASELEDVVLG